MARKKILSLYLDQCKKKEAIVQKIFQKTRLREGVKMKEVFDRVIPELADIINVQSCALFSVSPDGENVVLEAGYPDTAGYHGIGKTFPIKSEPAFELVLGLESHSDSADPLRGGDALLCPGHRPPGSEKISNNLKRFAADHNINSILYVPLNLVRRSPIS